MTQTIAIGDRVLFTNPATGQQLIGTVLSPHCQCDACRKWTVEFDSYMFREVNTRAAHVDAVDLAPLPAQPSGA